MRVTLFLCYKHYRILLNLTKICSFLKNTLEVQIEKCQVQPAIQDVRGKELALV